MSKAMDETISRETFEALAAELVEAGAKDDKERIDAATARLMDVTDWMGVGLASLQEQQAQVVKVYQGCRREGGFGLLAMTEGMDSKGEPVAADIYQIKFLRRMNPKAALAYMDELINKGAEVLVDNAPTEGGAIQH